MFDAILRGKRCIHRKGIEWVVVLRRQIRAGEPERRFCRLANWGTTGKVKMQQGRQRLQ